MSNTEALNLALHVIPYTHSAIMSLEVLVDQFPVQFLHESSLSTILCTAQVLQAVEGPGWPRHPEAGNLRTGGAILRETERDRGRDLQAPRPRA